MRPLRLDVVIGSKSDLSQCRDALLWLDSQGIIDLCVHVISCHRNPKSILLYVLGITPDSPVDVILAGAGMAAHLPGMLKTYLRWLGRDLIPVYGIGFEGKTDEQNLAARHSIDQLPGQPVIVCHGTAYFGDKGMRTAATEAVACSSILPPNAFPGDTCVRGLVERLPDDNAPAGKEAIFNLDWRTELGL